jgi:hypothetical protein
MGDAVDKAWFCARALVQLGAMIPSILWILLSIVIIPAYSGIGWYAPVFCSIAGIFLCLFILRSLWKRGRELRELFQVHINFDDWIDNDDEVVAGPLMCLPQEVSKRALDFHKWELKAAVALTLFFYGWSLVCWYAEWYILTPAEIEAHEAHSKCGCIKMVNGECVEASDLGPSCKPSECPADPNCRAWSEDMANKHSILMICPAVSEGADTYATFSCHADAAWLTLTGTIALMWLVTLLCRTICLPTPRKKQAIKAALPPMAKSVGAMAGDDHGA